MPTTAWVRTLACAAALLVSLALAQSSSLALPATGPASATVVHDVPQPLPDVIDIDVVVETALAQADRLPAATWELEALALELAFDLPAMHAFVRDHVAFDPYPGVLRGALGTLSARAGNAWDQALLLRELIDASGFDARFAFGTLDDDAVAALLASAPAGARVPLDDAPIAEVLAVDVARIGDRARRDHALLLGVLGDRTLGGAPGGAGAGDDRSVLVRDHVWVQALDDDGVWRDVDPAAPYGETLTAATTTDPSLPQDAWHTVVVRAIAETIDTGVLIESVVLEERFAASEAASTEAWFYLQPDGAGVGGTVVELLDGSAWLPVLLVDGEARAGTAFELGGSGGGGLLGNLFGDAGPELVALTLELETGGPGLAPATARRVLLDRAPAAARAAGEIDGASLEPLPEGGPTTAFGGLHHVMVSTGGANPRAHAIARAYAASFAARELSADDAATSFALGDLMLPLAVADRTLVLASERAVVDGLAAEGARAFVGRPRVYLTSLLPYPDVPDGTARVIDLALDGVDIVAARRCARGHRRAPPALVRRAADRPRDRAHAPSRPRARPRDRRRRQRQPGDGGRGAARGRAGRPLERRRARVAERAVHGRRRRTGGRLGAILGDRPGVGRDAIGVRAGRSGRFQWRRERRERVVRRRRAARRRPEDRQRHRPHAGQHALPLHGQAAQPLQRRSGVRGPPRLRVAPGRHDRRHGERRGGHGGGVLVDRAVGGHLPLTPTHDRCVGPVPLARLELRHVVGRPFMIRSVWVRSLICGHVFLTSLALAQPPSLALPVPGSAPTVEVRDTPQPRPDVIDVGAVEDAALAQADRLPPTTWEVEELALEPAFDLPAMHAFVRDHVAFDPYPGVLRGAQGTLAARAGNAWDQALLLHALATANDYVARFAFGTLDEATAAALVAMAPAGARAPLDDAPIAEVLAMDVARIGNRARRDYALLLEALGDRLVGGAEASRSALVRDHVWVQALDADGVWRNLDPAAPYGETLGAAESTAKALPEDAHHEVVVRAIAETLEEGVLVETVVLEERFLAADAAGSDLWFYVQPDREGVGGALATLFEGAAWLPVLMVDGEARRGTPFELGGSSGGLFGGGFFGSAAPDLVALRLELETRGPNLAPISSTRVLYDRSRPAARVAGAVVADELEPLPEEGAPSAFGALHHVMISTGGASPRAHAIARAYAANFAANELRAADDAATTYGLADLLLPLSVADETLVVASERAIVDGMAGGGARAFVARPRVFLASLLPFPGVEGGTARLIDLALDGVDVALPADAAPDAAARHRLWYGALQTALETEATLQAARAVDPETATLDGVSLAMAGAELRVVGPDDLASAEGPALREALGDGDLAVLVGDPGRFWAIDPASGATRSVLEPGVRVGFIGGGNYVNSAGGGVRYVIDEATGRTIGYIRDGKLYRYGRTPPSRCSGGTEYVMLLGCVSIPASMTVGMATGAVIVAIVAWSIVALEVILL